MPMPLAMFAPAALWSRSTRRSDSGNGSGFRMTRWTSVNTATFAAIDNANVATAAIVKIGARQSRRAACESSRLRWSIRCLDGVRSSGVVGRGGFESIDGSERDHREQPERGVQGDDRRQHGEQR